VPVPPDRPLRNVIVLLLPSRGLSHWGGAKVAGLNPHERSGFFTFPMKIKSFRIDEGLSSQFFSYDERRRPRRGFLCGGSVTKN
jgi:hypothetical protein